MIDNFEYVTVLLQLQRSSLANISKTKVGPEISQLHLSKTHQHIPSFFEKRITVKTLERIILSMPTTKMHVSEQKAFLHRSLEFRQVRTGVSTH